MSNRNPSNKKLERNDEILRRYKEGETYLAIAKSIGLSKNRVMVIVNRELLRSTNVKQ